MIAKADITRVLDTSALIHDPNSIYLYEDDIHITFTVLEELDNLKDRKDTSVSREARQCINNLEKIVSGYSDEELRVGVPIHPDSKNSNGKLIIGLDTVLEIIPALKKGIGSPADNSIINYGLDVKQKSSKPVMLISRDINMRLKARALGLEAEDVYDTGSVSNIQDEDFVYAGVGHIEGDLFDKAREESDVQIKRKSYRFPRAWFPTSVKPNFYWYDDSDHIGVITDIEGEYVYSIMIPNMPKKVFGVEPRNVRQKIALHQMLSDDYDLNILLGGAGSGKTGITASFFLIFVQTYLQTLFLLKKRIILY